MKCVKYLKWGKNINVQLATMSSGERMPRIYGHPFGLSRNQCRQIRGCLARYAVSMDIDYEVRPASSSSHRLINCIIENDIAKVEFLLPNVTVLINVTDIKRRVARRICSGYNFYIVRR